VAELQKIPAWIRPVAEHSGVTMIIANKARHGKFNFCPQAGAYLA
jgi:hypothetical protein